MLLVSYGGQGYAHVLRNMVPRFYEEGITKEQIDTMLIDNPAEYLDVEQTII